MDIISTLIEAHIVRERDGKIEFLLLLRSENQKYPNIWQMVTGKIKEKEKAYMTAIREIKEETGVNVDTIFVVPNVNSFYNSDDDSINLIPVFVTKMNYEQKITISKEHQDYKWVNIDDANKLLAWPGQEDSVNIINSYFTNKKENLNFIEIKIS